MDGKSGAMVTLIPESRNDSIQYLYGYLLVPFKMYKYIYSQDGSIKEGLSLYFSVFIVSPIIKDYFFLKLMTGRNEIWFNRYYFNFTVTKYANLFHDCLTSFTNLDFDWVLYYTTNNSVQDFFFITQGWSPRKRRVVNSTPRNMHKLFYIILTFCASYNSKRYS